MPSSISRSHLHSSRASPAASRNLKTLLCTHTRGTPADTKSHLPDPAKKKKLKKPGKHSEYEASWIDEGSDLGKAIVRGSRERDSAGHFRFTGWRGQHRALLHARRHSQTIPESSNLNPGKRSEDRRARRESEPEQEGEGRGNKGREQHKAVRGGLG